MFLLSFNIYVPTAITQYYPAYALYSWRAVLQAAMEN